MRGYFDEISLSTSSGTVSIERLKKRARRAGDVAADDGILSGKPKKMYEFPHNLFFAAAVEIVS